MTRTMNSKMNKTSRRLRRCCFLLRLCRFQYCHSVRAGRHYYGVHFCRHNIHNYGPAP